MPAPEPVEPEWLSFDETAAFLALPDLDVARLLLSGWLRFKVEKRSPNPRFVLRMDVWVNGEDVRDHQRDRWSNEHLAHADDLINRAALKFDRHPHRTSPGVRGRRQPKDT